VKGGDVPVNFDIRFVAHIQPVIATKVIKGRMVWVMARPHCVEIVLPEDWNKKE